MRYTPGGRLTFQQAYPMMIGTIQNATSVWYVPDRDAYININGTDCSIPAGGVQLVFDGDSTHENFHSGGAAYDIFAALVGGVVKIGTTHSWWSTNNRTGGYPGYTDVVRNSLGLKVNSGGALGTGMRFRYGNGATDIVDVPDGQAQYLGSIFMPSTASANWVLRLGPVASPGLACELDLYNEYNKGLVCGHTQIHLSGLDWSTTASGSGSNWQMFAGATGMRVIWFDGSGDNTLKASLLATCVTGHGFTGVALNNTNQPYGTMGVIYAPSGQRGDMIATDEAQLIGYNYYQAICAPDGNWDGWPSNDTITFGLDSQACIEFQMMN